MNNQAKLFFGVLAAAALLSSCGGKEPAVPDSGFTSRSAEVRLTGDVVPAWKNPAQMPLKPVNIPMDTGRVQDINLKIPVLFDITRPLDKITTSYEKYFITGVSDPGQPVYLDDVEIERSGTKGTFGVQAELKTGENEFTFSQGGVTKTVVITREEPVPLDSVQIKEIRQSSMVPSIYAGAKVGGELDVGCIAPSGASVSASFGGETVALEQVAVTEKDGIPAFFKGAIPVPESGYPDDLTRNSGKVSYVMEYDGETLEYESSGDVYISGKNSEFAVRVKAYMAFVFPESNLNELPVESEKLKKGAVDYVVSQGNSYVELSSGGFVSKERVEPVTGKVAVDNRLMRVKSMKSSNSESYAFFGTSKPAYLTSVAEDYFSITLYNTDGAPEASVEGSNLFSDVAVKSKGNSVTYTFKLKDDIWGYSVNYSGKSTVLTFNYKPRLSSGGLPLEGITVAIDPGHGGTEVGALGIAGLLGPAEKNVNLAHAYEVRDELEARGATVLLTLAEDSSLDLDSRLKFHEDSKADIFVSIHHNSIREDKDANQIYGVEVYYHTPMSENLADSLMAGVTSGLGRDERFVEQSYYRVTLNTYSPAALLELGYMSNPSEYENAANKSQIKKAAVAIADSIENALS